MNYLDPIRDQVSAMVVGFLALLPNLAIALVVLLGTWVISRFALSIAERVVGSTRMRASLKALAATVVKLLIWIVGLMIAAAIIFPGFTPAGMIAGLGIGAVAVGFAFQDIFENFFAGILIMLREKMRIGDVIECEGIIGRVEHITLRETHVRSLSNELTVVPNSLLFKNPVRILTDQTLRRHEIVVGVSYDTDLDDAAGVIRCALEALEGIDQDKGVEIYAQAFNSSSVDYLVRWWAGSTPKEGWMATDLVIRTIKRALDEADIEIPFPYMTHTFKEPLTITRPAAADETGTGAS